MLAEKIETYEDLEIRRGRSGSTCFQGFFFCKPIIANAKCTEVLQVSKLQLIRYIADPEVSFFDLANIIKRDLVLSYRLLKNRQFGILRPEIYGDGHPSRTSHPGTQRDQKVDLADRFEPDQNHETE